MLRRKRRARTRGKAVFYFSSLFLSLIFSSCFFIAAALHNIRLDKRVKLQSRKSIGFPVFVRVCGALTFRFHSTGRPLENVDDSAARR